MATTKKTINIAGGRLDILMNKSGQHLVMPALDTSVDIARKLPIRHQLFCAFDCDACFYSASRQGPGMRCQPFIGRQMHVCAFPQHVQQLQLRGAPDPPTYGISVVKVIESGKVGEIRADEDASMNHWSWKLLPKLMFVSLNIL
ncbi:hypothetical protein GGR50DRAFT_488963 [Xylaria sp. CBS 124048]|nr:hypothetical protein GGR50DRAFT_488963 [Xylaria sp. CBS 124048]